MGQVPCHGSRHERRLALEHKFTVGQIVELIPSSLRIAAAGRYEITHLMPEPDVSWQSPRYRIKSHAEIYQRVVPETDLTLPEGPFVGAPTDMMQRFSTQPGIILPVIED